MVDIVQCAYQNARRGVGAVFYIVFEQILLDLQPQEVMNDILHKQISIYFETSGAESEIGEKILSTDSFSAPIITFIQRRTGRDVVAECNAAKI